MMIEANLFRGLAPNNSPPHAQYDPEEDEPVLEPAWPHLQYVYEFLLRFVVSNETDPKVRRTWICPWSPRHACPCLPKSPHSHIPRDTDR